MSYMREVDASQDCDPPQEGDGNVVASYFDSASMVDKLCAGIYIPPSLQPPLELNHFSIAYWPTSDEAYENSASMEITFLQGSCKIRTSQTYLARILQDQTSHARIL